MTLEKIWNDWLHEEGHLSDVDFVDPNKEYHPLFGLGDEHSDVMVVGKAPALTVDDHSDKQYERTARAGSEPTDWPHSFDHYRAAWLGERLLSNQNKLIPVLRNLVADVGTLSFNDLYFTNVQKDPAFDTDRSETTDGYDPNELNKAAMATWSKYLGDEIAHVDPKLIVTFGKPATERIYSQLSGEQYGHNITDESGTASEVGGYTLLRFEHWDNYRMGGSAYGSVSARDEAHRQRFASVYK